MRRQLEGMFRTLDLAHDEIAVASEAARSEGQPEIANVLSLSVCNRPHLGLGARAERDAAACSSGAWGLGDAVDGAPLRASRFRSPRPARRKRPTQDGHKSV